jgi:predicted phage terminase large subunit-like protein
MHHEGFFRNTTIDGQVTGDAMDVGVIDDPIKGRAEAQSSKIRNATWDWITDDFMTRMADQAGLLMILTRWHVDDPAARMVEAFKGHVRLIKYAALAKVDEEHRKKGEPLFPELKSEEFLELRKSGLTKSGWESIYQQEPIVVGGELFPIEKFQIDKAVPARKDIKATVRYWDKAGTSGGGAYSCGVFLHTMRDGTTFISDVRRGQWSSMEREKMIKQTVELDTQDGLPVVTWVEQEPGSGGKESAENTIRNLRGFTVRADRVTGSKEIRAEPYAAQVQAGNVRLLKASWNRAFIDEHEEFPNGPYKDQVDATAGAFNKASAGTYDSSQSWVNG